MTIREALPHDFEQLAGLLDQLGYTLTSEELGRKIELFNGSEYSLLVSLDNTDTLTGFIALHVFESFHLDGRSGRITSFCVDEKHRGQGIGEKLLTCAENLFRQRNCFRVEVTSNERRQGAHEFYLKRGFVGGSRKFVKTFR